MNSNRFSLLAGLLPPEVDLDGLDADQVEALAFFANNIGDAEIDDEDDIDNNQVALHANALPLAFHGDPPAPVAADEALPLAFLPDPPAPVAVDEAPPLAFLAEPPAADEALLEEDPKNPWVVVVRRRNVVNPMVPRNPPPTPEDEPENICELEFAWVQKDGSIRVKRNWSKVRKSGFTGTMDGLAYFTYPLDV